MQIETEYDTQDAVPSEVRHLFRAEGEKFVLLGAAQLKTPEDVQRLQGALDKERNDHREAKGKLAKFGERDPDEILADLDKIAEYKQAAEGKLDDEKINGIVETRLKARTAPLERQIATLQTEKQDAITALGEFQAKDTRRTITDHVRDAAQKAKLLPGGVNDALFRAPHLFEIPEGGGSPVTRDGVGVTPGLPADVWLTEMQSVQPNWWPESRGAGSRGGEGGSGGRNPFSAEHWNQTEQGALVRADPAKADAMAKSAGTEVGGARPAAKAA